MPLENVQPDRPPNPIARDLVDSHLIERYLAQLAEIAVHMEKRLDDCERRLASLQEQLLQRNAMTARFTLHAHQQQHQLRLEAGNKALNGVLSAPQDNGNIFWNEVKKNHTPK